MASSSEIKSKTSVAGIVNDPGTQSRVIPESRRADGSIRKERRVKPGFTPAEDVRRFVPSRIRRAQEEEEEEARSGKSIPRIESHEMESARRSLAQLDVTDRESVVSSGQAAATTWRRRTPVRDTATSIEGSWRNATKSVSNETSKNKAAHDQAGKVKKVVDEKIPDDWDAEGQPSAIEANGVTKSQTEGKTTAIDKRSESDANLARDLHIRPMEGERPEDQISSLSETLESLTVSKESDS